MPGQYGHILAAPSPVSAYHSVIGGNVELQPEIATTRTIGLVLEPRILRNFNLTLDWRDIGLDGAIAQVGAQSILNNCLATGDPFFCNRIHRDPNGSLWLGNGYVDDRQANIGSLRVRGVDIGTDYSAPVGRWGSAHFEFHGSYVLRWITDKGGFSMPYDCVGLFGDPCGIHPQWKHVARATWDTPSRHSLSINWRHTSGVTLAALDPKFNLTDSVSAANARLAAQDYFDLATRIRIRKEVELRLGVNNIFDRQPPRIVRNTAAGVGPVNGNTYPEWYDALGRYIFASATMNFRP
jgi:outer membrane receptor protein involved in Fe transport